MENDKPGKKKVLPIILAIIVIGSLVFGISKYIYSMHHVDTDDAQIDNDISPVLARVSGYVNEIHFEDNQHVNKGDTLIKLDDRDLQIRVEQAKAALQNSDAGITVAKANVATAEANLDATQSVINAVNVRVWKATQEFNRYNDLLAEHAVTQQQFDAVKAEKETAEASLQTAKKQQAAASMQVKSSQQLVAAAESGLAQRQADVNYAMLQLSYTGIIAPSSGIATKKNAQPGQLVNAGMPLFSVVSDENTYVIGNFKETQLTKMKEGLSAEVIVDAFPDEKIEGVVYRLSAATGAKFSLLPPDNATGNFVKVVQRVPVKIKLTGTKEMLSRLRPGMSVKVSVHLD